MRVTIEKTEDPKSKNSHFGLKIIFKSAKNLNRLSDRRKIAFIRIPNQAQFGRTPDKKRIKKMSQGPDTRRILWICYVTGIRDAMRFTPI